MCCKISSFSLLNNIVEKYKFHRSVHLVEKMFHAFFRIKNDFMVKMSRQKQFRYKCLILSLIIFPPFCLHFLQPWQDPCEHSMCCRSPVLSRDVPNSMSLSLSFLSFWVWVWNLEFEFVEFEFEWSLAPFSRLEFEFECDFWVWVWVECGLFSSLEFEFEFECVFLSLSLSGVWPHFHVLSLSLSVCFWVWVWVECRGFEFEFECDFWVWVWVWTTLLPRRHMFPLTSHLPIQQTGANNVCFGR